MSAFLCSDETLQVLVYSAMRSRGLGGLRWYWDKNRQTDTYQKAGLEQLDFDQADRVIRMLREENVRSLKYRYPDSPDMWADLAVVSYTRTLAFRTEPTAVEVLKTTSCYEYQSCEHPEWEDSEAFAFCQALRHRMIGNLEGYDSATGWDWSAEEFQKRTAGMVSLSGLIARKGRK